MWGGAVATYVGSDDTWTLVTREAFAMVAGDGEWSVTFTLEAYDGTSLFLGLVRPGLNDRGSDGTGYWRSDESRAWWMGAWSGALYGSGKHGSDSAGELRAGDRLTVVLTAKGAVRFGVNGTQHGPGWRDGSIQKGTVVVPAVHMWSNGYSVKLEAATGAEETAWAR